MAPLAEAIDPSREAIAPSNAEQLSQLVALAAAIFYAAEEGENPGVKTYIDALHYIATSLSVGYANIFPVTQMGKLIGAVVQMVGPALSARALDSGAASAPQSDPALLARLDAILEELRLQRARPDCIRAGE
jgi:hypothetical protein